MEFNKLYYWKRSNGWKWQGVDRWWEFFVELLGLNGSGGYWIKIKAKWNGSEFMNHLDEVKTLSWEDSQKLEKEVEAALVREGDV